VDAPKLAGADSSVSCTNQYTSPGINVRLILLDHGGTSNAKLFHSAREVECRSKGQLIQSRHVGSSDRASSKPNRLLHSLLAERPCRYLL